MEREYGDKQQRIEHYQSRKGEAEAAPTTIGKVHAYCCDPIILLVRLCPCGPVRRVYRSKVSDRQRPWCLIKSASAPPWNRAVAPPMRRECVDTMPRVLFEAAASRSAEFTNLEDSIFLQAGCKVGSCRSASSRSRCSGVVAGQTRDTLVLRSIF